MRPCSPPSFFPLFVLEAFLIFQDGEHYFLFCFAKIKMKSCEVSKIWLF